MSVNRKPKVTVCVVTYNQEDFIAKCLQSIIEQETDFEFEIIVGDDSSKDGTADIILDFAKRYPNLIKPIIRTINVGAGENFIDIHRSATGEYIAHVDGDDYWLPTKLQKQVDFLDNNKKCNIVWTRSLYYNGDKTLADCLSDDKLFVKKFYRPDIIKYISIGTNSSHMYRSICKLTDYPEFDVVDYYKNVVTVGDGYGSFVNDEPLTVYRVGVGVSSSGCGIVKLMFKSMTAFKQMYPQDKKNLFAPSLLMFYSSMKRKRFILAAKFLSLALACFSVKGGGRLKNDMRIYKMFVVPKFNL
ncbi:glycosyl transferase [Vibrio splendidus]|uniref:glycosyltransferase family 2 protein n=1 Tax=Vibrio splendidus TaxID=29497 RepID=UPI000D33944C|nr:glycosyltransferase [Vibrio splendidus]PTO51480.1 glycosyl transferase [Vibrio splendidus]